MEKKCKFCKEKFDVYSTKFVMYGTKTKTFAHFDCHIKKELSKKTNKLSKQELEELANEKYREDLWYIMENDAKDELYTYIMYQYDLINLPQYLYIKLSSIFNGTKEGMSQPLSPVYLLDMWKQQQSYLNNTRQYYITNKGKHFDKIGSVNFDLAVLLNMANDYMYHLEKNEKYNTYKSVFSDYDDISILYEENRKDTDDEDIDISEFL